MSSQPNIVVVGGGVVGITVAKLLQDRLNDINLTIIADKFTDDTTSAVAAGIFRPGTSFTGPTSEITKKWVDDSYYYWDDLLKTPDAPKMGIMSLSGYIFSKDNYHVTRNHLIEDLLPIYRAVTDDELKLGPPGARFGSYFATLKIECGSYLPWTERLLTNKGAKIVTKKIDSLSSLKGYDLVFNCTGLGAKYLCNDHDLVPLRGQVTRVKAPWIKMAYYGDYDTYILPGMNGIVTLGGVRQYDSYNLNICRHDRAAILERCYELLPNLRKAEIICDKVGLRPHRRPVRVEQELVEGLKVVHCYGHGGYGVTCAPGTAKHAVDLGLDLLRSNLRNKL